MMKYAPSSCWNSLFALISFAFSRLSRPVIPRPAKSSFSFEICWHESRSLKSLDHTLRTPHARTRDYIGDDLSRRNVREEVPIYLELLDLFLVFAQARLGRGGAPFCGWFLCLGRGLRVRSTMRKGESTHLFVLYLGLPLLRRLVNKVGQTCLAIVSIFGRLCRWPFLRRRSLRLRLLSFGIAVLSLRNDQRSAVSCCFLW